MEVYRVVTALIARVKSHLCYPDFGRTKISLQRQAVNSQNHGSRIFSDQNHSSLNIAAYINKRCNNQHDSTPHTSEYLSQTSFQNLLPTLPLLPTHSHQPIKQLLSQPHSGNFIGIAILVDDLQPIGNHLTCSPPNHNLRLPAQASNLLQLPNFLNRDAEFRTCVFRFKTSAIT